MTITTRCNSGSSGKWFPFDEYSCSLNIGPGRGDTGQIELRWPNGNSGDTLMHRNQMVDDQGEWHLLGELNEFPIYMCVYTQ